MPGGDGMGPPTGRGQRGGRKRGNLAGSGPGGNCVCPGCGEKAPHKPGTPCYTVNCPKCGTRMTRE
ncbi:MAG: hypothetical protein WC370_08490 [Dehalococcoidales bacterium]|jgi:hypothetical protein